MNLCTCTLVYVPISSIIIHIHHTHIELCMLERMHRTVYVGENATMAGILAKEAIFGEDIMVQCTAKGYGDKPGLPIVELMELKEEMRKLYPYFQHSPAEFEEKWVKICDTLSQACKRLRHKAKK